MSTCSLRRLGSPDQLRSIDARYLNELLSPYRAFLEKHGITLPLGGRDAPLKYIALVQLLLAPPEDMPADFSDAVYYIDGLATPSGIDALEAAAKAAGISVWLERHLDVTPAEIVLKLWLKNRPLVERVHAEMTLGRLRSFEYFQPDSVETPFLDELPKATVQAMETELNQCFYVRRRGRYARILLSETKGNVWLYIGHGGLLRRVGTVKDRGTASICYRPELYDAVVFVRATGELGINARSQWETSLYQRLCGKHLFGNEQLFVGRAKYTLSPLLEYGRNALQCRDIPGMEWVRLTHVLVQEHGSSPRLDSSSSDDLFDSWGTSGLPYSPGARLVSARFHIKIAGCRAPQRVVIRPSNRAQYSQDSDQPWIETWFRRRGFIHTRGTANDDAHQDVLAVA